MSRVGLSGLRRPLAPYGRGMPVTLRHAHWRAGMAAALVVLGAAHARAQADDEGGGAVPSGASGAIVKRAAPAEEQKKPVIVLPEIVHFENAPYPAEAQAAGVTGDVVLKLTVDKEGNVTDAEVLTPAGHGFDEAAQRAALAFKFKPASRDGVPFAAKIPWRYSFTLTAPAPAAPPPPPTTGNLGGTLSIAGTSTALAGVEIVVRLPSGEERRARTDAEGGFKLTDLPPGKYKISIAAPGYEGLESEEDVLVGEETVVKYPITPESEGIQITVTAERPPREVTRRTIERREIDRIPGTSGDALRSLQSLPGVARPPGLAGLLIVRGSSPEGTATFVDGSDVPLIYHFGGLSSVVPTELLDKIDFYPGNFSARYGRVGGGIVDVGLRAPDVSCNGPYGKPRRETGCFHGMVQADLIDTRMLVQGPLPAKGWSFAVAGRRSWLDTWLKPLLESAGSNVTSAPVYYDYQLIAEHNTEGSRTSFRVFGADDRFEIIITDPAAEDPAFGGNLSLGTSFFRVQGLNQARFSRSLELTSMVSVGKNTTDFSLGTFLFQLHFVPLNLREELTIKASPAVRINAGLDFQIAPYDVLVRAPEPPRPGEPDPGPFAARPFQETQQKSTAFRPAGYIEGELQPSDRLRVVPGVRFDYARDSGHFDFSPRINGRYDIVKGSAEGSPNGFVRRTTIKGGVGLFAQPPEFQETDVVFGTPGIESNRAVHYALGVEQDVTQKVELSVEGFYKDLTNQVARAANVAGGFDYNNEGSGYVVGLETLLKFKPDERFFGWVSYTLSRSVRRDSADSESYLFEYDQTHNLIVLGSYRLGRGWEFGARFRIVSGPLDTPAVGPPSLPALYAADAAAYVPLQGKAFGRRLPLFHQVDLRVDKRWQFRAFRLSAYLDVQNAYNHAATEALIYNYNFSKQGYQTGIPVIPSIGLRGEL